MINDFNSLDAQSEISNLAQVDCDEVYTQADYDRDIQAAQGGEPDAHLEAAYEARTEIEEPAGWPGDGSGTDDLADYNANEAADYCNE